MAGHTVERPDFPTVIDNSMRSTFVACPRKFELQYLHSWATPRESIHLRAGGAFAKGLEVTRRHYWGAEHSREHSLGEGAKALIHHYGGEDGQALDENSAKDLETMLIALADYFYHHGWETDNLQPFIDAHGEPAVEFSFAMPLEVRHPQTGNPILYGGKFDMLGTYDGRQVWVVDEKTTGQLGATWAERFSLSSQFTGYCWGAKQYGIPVAGAVVRGVSVQKTQVKHAESIQNRPQWMIDRWYDQLHRDILRMISLWQEGYFDYNLGDACSAYGGCPFRSVCTSPHPERWLEAEFVKRTWNPLET